MSKKIYLPFKEETIIPVNEDELFSIGFSSEGIVITLNKFGYKDIHITIYIKEIDEINKTIKINAHLTKENKEEKYKEKLLEFERTIDLKKIEKYVKEKEEKIAEIYLNHQKSIKQKYNPRRIICSRCAGKELKLSLKSKKKALEAYQKIENFEFTNEIIHTCHSCKEEKHNPHYHLRKRIILYKIGDKYQTEKQAKKFIEKIKKEIFSEVYEIIEKEIKPIREEFERVMKEHKDK
jgi:hypothetical protein